jgi:phosphomevalonate kinase
MKVAAPGKLLLTGAYAVLDGWPALVVAIDRYAVADGDGSANHPTPEVLAAMPASAAPSVDASALRDDNVKLGLGSSAAMLVASLGVLAVRRGERLDDRTVRDGLFSQARKAHAVVQGGGSGVDVAASVYGGSLEYRLRKDGTSEVQSLVLPRDVVLDVFWSGAPVTTTDMRSRVDAFRSRDSLACKASVDAVGTASSAAIASARRGESTAFIAAVGDGARALAALGLAADAPIFPLGARELALVAEADGAVFLPSGAGGGDVFVHLATRSSSARFRTAATAAGMRPISMQIDTLGLRVAG